MTPLIIHWFRQDLRLADNPALYEAVKDGRVLPVYILDDENAGEHKMGGASRWFLHHALASLNKDLDGRLALYKGKTDAIIPKLVKDTKATGVYWNRCYEPWRITRDETIKKALIEDGIDAQSFNGSLLWEPWEVRKPDGDPYKVFTPFYRRGCMNAQPPRARLPKIENAQWADKPHDALSVNGLDLLPTIRWDRQLDDHWEITEDAALERLDDFIAHDLKRYKEARDVPSSKATSRLSPYLHFGLISPNQMWYKARSNDRNSDMFRSELGWREFSYSLLYHFPELPEKNWQSKFDGFPWRASKRDLEAWKRGQTGIPIVDAGMRELWQTGYMHNRVRMIAASYLIKNLMIDWRLGEAWFWDCLADADLASNSASWQWVAGSGADAAPYFRIFNPVTQGQTFDPNGEYVRAYVPELHAMPDKYLHNPWEAPDVILEQAGVRIGHTYPAPLTDLKTSRERALAAYKALP